MIPVGPGTLGRIMNVTGDPIDERGPIKGVKLAPIHAEAPEFVDQSTSAEVLITGIKGNISPVVPSTTCKLTWTVQSSTCSLPTPVEERLVSSEELVSERPCSFRS